MSLTPIIGPTSVPRYFPREDLIFEGSFAFPYALVPRPDGTPLKEGQVRRFGGEALIGRPNPLKHIFHLWLEMKRRQDTPKGKIMHNGRDREPGVEVTNPLIMRKPLLDGTRIYDFVIHIGEKQGGDSFHVEVINPHVSPKQTSLPIHHIDGHGGLKHGPSLG